MFNALTDKLQDTIQSLRGQKKISETNLEASISQVRRALLESDVSLKAVKLFTTRVTEKALGEEVLRGVKPGEQFVKIISDALTEILGGEASEISAEPGAILLLGLQGAGKTTAAAKLAYKLKKEGKKPLLVPCDLQRPAAIKQLKVLAEQAEVDFLDFLTEGVKADDGIEAETLEAGAHSSKEKVKSITDVAKLAKKYAADNDIHTIIYDTAGRLQVDTELMAELLLLEKFIKPNEKLLVIDSLIGQEAVNVAETFDTQIGISGVLLTKLDGDSKGGAALSVVEATQKAIKLASVGEKLEDLEQFHPDRMASRILGMGDVVSLVEKAQEKIDEEEAKRLEAQLLKGTFNYETFMAAQKMMSKIGDMGSMFKMLGMGSMMSQMGLGSADQENMLEQGEARTAKFKAAINSMTIKERREPEIMSQSRKRRIAKGCGLSDNNIDQLISEFDKMRKMFKNLGPMLQMMQGNTLSEGGDPSAQDVATLSGQSSDPSSGGGFASPMDMLGGMMQGAMSKKQKKAMKQMGGGMPGMKALSGKAPKKKAKKGQKPSIKGFRD